MRTAKADLLEAVNMAESQTSGAFGVEYMNDIAVAAKWTAGAEAGKTFATTDVHIGANTILIVAYAFVAAQPVQLTTTGTLPAGLALATTYYVLAVSANYLSLAATAGGAAIDITDEGTGTHTITPLAYAPTFPITAVDPTVDTISILAHGLADEMPIQLTTTGVVPAGLTAATTYYVILVDANTFQLETPVNNGAINITDKGTGVHTATPLAYAPTVTAANIDYLADTITIVGHGFVDELEVQLTTTTTLPAGLAAVTDYYVIVTDANTFQLEASVGGGAINITDKGTGTHTVTPTTYAPTAVAAAINASDNTIYIATHAMTLDLRVQLTTSGTLPAGFAAVTDYFVITVNTNDFQLSLSVGGAAVDITDKGTGTHTITPLAYAPTFSPSAVDAALDTIAITNHTFAEDEHVVFTTAGTLPAGLSLATPYYVLIQDASSIKVSATPAGAAVNITDQGTGTHTATRSTAADNMENVSVAESLITLAAHEFVENEVTRVTTTGTLPAPLVVSTDYFVLVIDANTIQLEASVGGGALAINDHGVGTTTITRTTAADDMELISIVDHNIVLASHSYVEDEVVQFTTDGALPGGLSLATDYFIIATDANNVQVEATLGGGAVDLTSRGTGTHTLTRGPAAATVDRVSALGDEIYIAAHGFVENEVIQLSTTGTLPAGLALVTDYYILNADTNAFQVETSVGNGAENITDVGTGTHTATRTTAADNIEAIAEVGEEMEITAHGFVDEQVIQFTTSGTLPAGLSLATDYYVMYLDVNTIRVATSRANAQAGTAVNLTDVGTGTHTATPETLAGSVKLQYAVVKDPVTADWVDVGSGAITIPGAGSPLGLVFSNQGYRALRAVFTPTAGSGTLTYSINAKGV